MSEPISPPLTEAELKELHRHLLGLQRMKEFVEDRIDALIAQGQAANDHESFRAFCRDVEGFKHGAHHEHYATVKGNYGKDSLPATCVAEHLNLG